MYPCTAIGSIRCKTVLIDQSLKSVALIGDQQDHRLQPKRLANMDTGMAQFGDSSSFPPHRELTVFPDIDTAVGRPVGVERHSDNTITGPR